MKYLKIFGALLLVVIAVTFITSLVLPPKQRVERSIVIHAPAAQVYAQLIKLENINKWSVWNRKDSTVKHILTGTDGTIGAATSWTGDPEISGDGKIVIRSLNENKKIIHDLVFTKPKEGQAESEFILTETNGATTLTWEFDMATPRPWNIFNLFHSLDKEMGKDFEEGLVLIKAAIESKNDEPITVRTYEVAPMNFPATTFALVRQQIKWSDIASFYAQHLPVIYTEAQKARLTGKNKINEVGQANVTQRVPAGLYYSWDELNKQTDMAAAIPVPAGTKLESTMIQVVDIPASKAVYVNYYGAYDKSADAYSSIDKYLAANNLKQKTPVIEQYITDPAIEKDTTKWLTKIIFLVQ